MAAPAVLSRLPITGGATSSAGAPSAGNVPILNDDGVLDPSFITGNPFSGALFFEMTAISSGVDYFTVDTTSAGFGAGHPNKIVYGVAKPTADSDNIFITNVVVLSETSLGVSLNAPTPSTGYTATILAS